MAEKPAAATAELPPEAPEANEATKAADASAAGNDAGGANHSTTGTKEHKGTKEHDRDEDFLSDEDTQQDFVHDKDEKQRVPDEETPQEAPSPLGGPAKKDLKKQSLRVEKPPHESNTKGSTATASKAEPGGAPESSQSAGSRKQEREDSPTEHSPTKEPTREDFDWQGRRNERLEKRKRRKDKSADERHKDKKVQKESAPSKPVQPPGQPGSHGATSKASPPYWALKEKLGLLQAANAAKELKKKDQKEAQARRQSGSSRVQLTPNTKVDSSGAQANQAKPSVELKPNTTGKRREVAWYSDTKGREDRRHFASWDEAAAASQAKPATREGKQPAEAARAQEGKQPAEAASREEHKRDTHSRREEESKDHDTTYIK